MTLKGGGAAEVSFHQEQEQGVVCVDAMTSLHTENKRDNQCEFVSQQHKHRQVLQ